MTILSKSNILETPKKIITQINRKGSLELSPEIVSAIGLKTGENIVITVDSDKIQLTPSIHSLSRLYIEPTSKCNLSCKTCIRKSWKEQMGTMNIKTFNRLCNQLKEFPSLRSIMFGGFGEPTSHQEIIYMIKQVKSLGMKVEITTNGTLLDENMLTNLINSKLDTLWVSFDGTSESCFEDIREGALFKNIVENLKLLHLLNENNSHKIEVGLAFVAMKKNIEDLPNLFTLARTVGAKKILISNVLPYSREMNEQMLYKLVLSDLCFPDIHVSLPRMDITHITKEPLYDFFRIFKNISIIKNSINPPTSKCRFIEDRCAFIRWDGEVSPCMGLLHSYTTFLNDNQREVTSCSMGNILSNTLREIWSSSTYYDFREKVDSFDFSPCYTCGGCTYSEKNEEDCIGNSFPTCGGCLWAQGVIQCP